MNFHYCGIVILTNLGELDSRKYFIQVEKTNLELGLDLDSHSKVY